MKNNKPNILFVMTDQHRFDALGCYGNTFIDTPNLDWLAAEGTIFSSAYTCTPSCIPARASLLTGMDPWNTGVIGNPQHAQIGSRFPQTLPGELAKAGYHTIGIGKMNFRPQRLLNGFHQTIVDESDRVESPDFQSDYNEWFAKHKTGDYGTTDHGLDWNSWMARPFHAPEYLHPVNWAVNESIRFLQKRDPSKPFFLKLSLNRPHSPYDPPSYYFDLYRNKPLPTPPIGDWAHIHDVTEADTYGAAAWRGKKTEQQQQLAKAGYYGLIQQIDQQLGRLFMQLHYMGLWQNTVIMFTSDHGDMLGDHHLWRKTYAYEGSAHIPMMVRLPDSIRPASATKNNRVDKVSEPVCLQDVLPTLLDVAGIAIPEKVDGRSLLPLVFAEKEQEQQRSNWRDYVHGEHGASYSPALEMHFLTDGKWKYIWYTRTNQEQLFHLEQDPSELYDLANRSTHEGELLRWRSRLVKELEQRNAGLTNGEQLVCQADRPSLVSPNLEKYVHITRV